MAESAPEIIPAAGVTTPQEPVPPPAKPNGADPTGQAQPPDWRAEWAGADEKRGAFAQRYADPKAVLESAWQAQQTIAKGAHKAGLPENATPQQLSDYRKANGIPETPEGYTAKLPEGLVIGELDKPVIERYTKLFHDLNLPPAAAHKLIADYYAFQDEQAGQVENNDKMAHARLHKALQGEWSADFDLNMNHTTEFLDSAPPEVDAILKTARVSDGTPFGPRLLDSPEFVRWIAGLARQVNPISTIVGGGGSQGVDIHARHAELKALAGKPNSEYWKGPKAQQLQDEHLKVIDTINRLSARDQKLAKA